MKPSIHKDPSPLAGKTVEIKQGKYKGQTYRVEDWWDRLGQGSWMYCSGNISCLNYAIRSVDDSLPMDDEVLYGKIGGLLGYLVHVSELEPALEPEATL